MDSTEDEWSRESLFLEYVQEEDFPEDEIFLQLLEHQLGGKNETTRPMIAAIIGELITKAVDIAKCKKQLHFA